MPFVRQLYPSDAAYCIPHPPCSTTECICTYVRTNCEGQEGSVVSVMFTCCAVWSVLCGRAVWSCCVVCAVWSVLCGRAVWSVLCGRAVRSSVCCCVTGCNAALC